MTVLRHGETAGREVSKRVLAPVADEAALALVSSTDCADLASIRVGAAWWYYDAASSASGSSGSVVVPADSPSTGRFLIDNPLGDVPAARTITAGAGLTGGGDLSANRTLTVGAGTGITVNADDVAVAFGAVGEMASGGVAAANAVGTTDKSARIDHVHAHGAQAGGTAHAEVIAAGAAGFMSGADKTRLDDLQAARVQKVTLTADHTTITAAAGTETINIGSALPNNSRIVGVDMHTLTPFSGGTVGDFTVDVGTSGDVDALIDGADLFAGAVDGGPATMPKGIRPNKFFASGGQLIATFICGSDDVADATAGAVTIDVLYQVLA